MSSFRKRNIQKPIPGTRTSPQTGQLITSSGNPSLDLILGGGLPIGSICLIEEDKYVTHSKVLTKYFLAEGVFSDQSIFLGSLEDDPAELLRKLPRPLDDEEVEKENAAEQENGDASKNGLRIAWRYNDLPMVNSEQSTYKIGHHFNLLEQMDPLMLDYVSTVLWPNTADQEGSDGKLNAEQDGDDEYTDFFADESTTAATKDVEYLGEIGKSESTTKEVAPSKTDSDQSEPGESADQDDQMDSGALEQNLEKGDDENMQIDASSRRLRPPPPYVPLQKPKIFQNEKYMSLLNMLQPFLREGKFTTGALGDKSLCRVCIASLGSPLWYDEEFPKDILKFLTILRAAVRSSVSVCFITMPMHLVAKCDETLVPKIRNLVDYAIELESFAGSERETNPAFKEYNGLLHLHKISAVNTLSAYMPETSDLAFKLRRKKFVIEKLHLPPELQENTGESGDAAMPSPTLSCGSNRSPNPQATLDF